MDLDDILDGGLDLANGLAFLLPEVPEVAGALTFLSLVELFVPHQNAVVAAIEQSTKVIVTHIDELAKIIPEELKQFENWRHLAEIKAADTWLEDATFLLKNIQHKAEEGGEGITPEENEDLWREFADIDGPGAYLRVIIADSESDNMMKPNYATLGIRITAACTYLNCCRFMANWDYLYAAQEWFNVPDGQEKPPRPTIESGSHGKNATIYGELKRTVEFVATPRAVEGGGSDAGLLQGINQAVIERKKRADEAAGTVKIERPSVPVPDQFFTLNPTVAIFYRLGNGAADFNYYNGYGFFSEDNAKRVCTLRNAQHRAKAWNAAKAEFHLELLPERSILKMNHTIFILHGILEKYAKILGEDTPEPLSGIYPPTNEDPAESGDGVSEWK